MRVDSNAVNGIAKSMSHARYPSEGRVVMFKNDAAIEINLNLKTDAIMGIVTNLTFEFRRNDSVPTYNPHLLNANYFHRHEFKRKTG